MSKKPAPVETPAEPVEEYSLIIWKGPTGWIRAEPDGTTASVKVNLIVDEIATPTVEVGRFALDDAHLSRLVALVEGGCAVELRDRPPFEPSELTPAEMLEINERADQIRLTLGDRAAEEFIAERTGGAI